MPVYPGEYHKMQPNTAYALYHDGEDGKYVLYYSRDGEEIYVRGDKVASAYRELQTVWTQLETFNTQTGTFAYFKRSKPGQLHHK